MILHHGGNVCPYVSFHNLPIYAQKTLGEEKGVKANEQNWRRIFYPKKIEEEFVQLLIHSSGWFYRGSVDELPSTKRVGIKVTRVKERKKSNKN